MHTYEETMTRRPAKPVPQHAAGNPNPTVIDRLLAKFDTWAGIPERYEDEEHDPLVLM